MTKRAGTVIVLTPPVGRPSGVGIQRPVRGCGSSRRRRDGGDGTREQVASTDDSTGPPSAVDPGLPEGAVRPSEGRAKRPYGSPSDLRGGIQPDECVTSSAAGSASKSSLCHGARVADAGGGEAASGMIRFRAPPGLPTPPAERANSVENRSQWNCRSPQGETCALAGPRRGRSSRRLSPAGGHPARGSRKGSRRAPTTRCDPPGWISWNITPVQAFGGAPPARRMRAPSGRSTPAPGSC